MKSVEGQAGRKFYQRKWFWILACVIFIVILASGGDSSTPTPSAPVVSGSSTDKPTLSKVEAQKELDDVIGLAKKAGLVTSYEFSDKASVVYAGSTWYSQSVQFKKDFMAKVGTLKKAITGYSHFEVRDANSNEKVAEITSFSQSLEVYK